MLSFLGRDPVRLCSLCGQWNLPEASPSGPSLAVLRFMGKIESWDLRFKYLFKDFFLYFFFFIDLFSLFPWRSPCFHSYIMGWTNRFNYDSKSVLIES